MKQLVCLLLLVGISGCSSISQQECQLGDWYAIGKTDGEQGIAASQFRTYQKECSKHGLNSDYPAYQRGHAAGAIQFCQYDNGIAWGQQGKSYNTLCVGALEAEFKLGYERGRNWYKAKLALENLQQVLARNKDTIRSLEQRMDENTDLIGTESDQSVKAHLKKENRSLQQQLRELNQSQGQLQQELKQAELEFSLLQQEER